MQIAHAVVSMLRDTSAVVLFVQAPGTGSDGVRRSPNHCCYCYWCWFQCLRHHAYPAHPVAHFKKEW